MRLLRCLPLLAALMLVACERPLVDPLEVRVQVVSPDLDEALVVSTLTLQVRALSGAPGTTLRIAGQDAPLDTTRGVYTAMLRLAPGLNALPVEVLEAGQVATRDTLYALRLDVRPAPPGGLPPLPARAGASATRLDDGTTVLTGGLGTAGPLATATRIAPSGAISTVGLATPRIGHTASLLPSGEVLLLGGATVLDPTSPPQFVPTAEIVAPEGGSGGPLVIEGGGFLRAGHTARVLTSSTGRTLLYVYGGRDASVGLAAPTGTVAILEWTADRRLVRLTPPTGAGAFLEADGHLQLDLPGLPARAVVLDGTPPDGNATRFTWREPGVNYPFDMRADPLDGLFTPRTGAAAADLGGGVVLIVGGRTPGGEVTGTMEAYAPAIGRAFRLPPGAGLGIPRERARAAILSDRRMVVIGGLGRTGTLVGETEVFFF